VGWRNAAHRPHRTGSFEPKRNGSEALVEKVAVEHQSTRSLRRMVEQGAREGEGRELEERT